MTHRPPRGVDRRAILLPSVVDELRVTVLLFHLRPAISLSYLGRMTTVAAAANCLSEQQVYLLVGFDCSYIPDWFCEQVAVDRFFPMEPFGESAGFIPW